MNTRLLRVFALCAAIVGAGNTQAALVGYSLNIATNNLGGASANVPGFILTNTSTSASIVGFDFTIGLTSKNFDAIYTDNDNNNTFVGSASGSNPLTGIGYVVNNPDGNASGVIRSNVIDIDFTGFGATEAFRFLADVDTDSANTTENFRTVFFNNGASPNSLLTVSFSDGNVLSLSLPDQVNTNASFSFSDALNLPDAPANNVPEPAGLMLVGLALAGLGVARRKGVSRQA